MNVEMKVVRNDFVEYRVNRTYMSFDMCRNGWYVDILRHLHG